MFVTSKLSSKLFLWLQPLVGSWHQREMKRRIGQVVFLLTIFSLGCFVDHIPVHQSASVPTHELSTSMVAKTLSWTDHLLRK